MIHRIRCALMRAHIRQLRTIAGMIVPMTASDLVTQANLYGRAAQVSARLAAIEMRSK